MLLTNPELIYIYLCGNTTKVDQVMKIAENRLRKIIKEELESSVMPDLSGLLSEYLGCLRSLGLWFHGAHQLAKGTGFAGDHVHLYGDIYNELVDDYDAAAEKALGLTGDEGVACPHKILEIAAEKMAPFKSPSGSSADEIATTALKMVRHHLVMVEGLFNALDHHGLLTLGMDDFLAASANRYESWVYLLGQRVKKV